MRSNRARLAAVGSRSPWSPVRRSLAKLLLVWRGGVIILGDELFSALRPRAGYRPSPRSRGGWSCLPYSPVCARGTNGWTPTPGSERRRQ
jgi:hypothetical protein